MDQARRYCEDCGRYVVAQRNSFNHFLHGIITLFCCGFYLPVWVTLYLTHNPPYLCQRCGDVTSEYGPRRRRRRDGDA